MRKAINGILWLIGLVVVLVVYFFVPLGTYTLYEHTLRIAATEPAQELGDELGTATRELGERAVEEWDGRRATREQAAGREPGGAAPDTLRLRVEPDGVHIGQEVLSPTELRSRIHEAREVAGELHAILETAEGVPTPDVQAILEMLREEHVSVAP
ncbi:MAG: hypothetical protein H6719_26785 [Sandaracinaceae bacterium]|nr:hypothetical protein [Sandaracinaceae bacterium]